jgi:threonylcarbamoyladenosine tRNA methylthiotransferase MtaB
MPSFYIEQFGCRATQADAAALERQLRDRGCCATRDAGSADVVIVNTCTVTSAADTQARDTIRRIHISNPSAQIIATGCYAQRAPEELAALPGVTWVVGNYHKPQIPDLCSGGSSDPSIQESPTTQPNVVLAATLLGAAPFRFQKGVGLEPASSTAKNSYSDAQKPLFASTREGSVPPSPSSTAYPYPKILTGDIFAQTTLLAAPLLGGENEHTRPILKIQDGCNLRCSYCVIPFVRGKSRSLPAQQVINEIRRLADSGYREVVLSGINLGMYGRDLSPRVEFEDLLRRILDETSISRLRISSIEPMDVTSDLIALFASTDRLARHFHMPLQSGADKILAAMHRWYRAEHYARRLELIREQIPDAAIGADVIAGFPGESDANHNATLNFIERLPFTYLHVFSFSKRPGTSAASRTDEVPAAVIHARARQLRALSEAKSAAFYASQSGKELQVLTLRHARPEISASARPSPVGAQHAAPHLRNMSATSTIPRAGTRDGVAPASVNPWTPAISSNYLHVRVSGVFPPNQMLTVSTTGSHGAHYLNARTDATPAFAYHDSAQG